MIARTGSGWQYALADLALILFLATAASLGEPRAGTAPALPAVPALGDPVAVWQAGTGRPGLQQWLASQPGDPRLRLTLVATYAAGGGGRILAQAQDLLATAGPRRTRIVLEPGAEDALAATLTWDVAQPLREPGDAAGAPP